jgi:hypothetical protein
VISASAIPGATTASEVFFEAPMAWKLFTIPQTVPNKPMNGDNLFSTFQKINAK